MTDAQKPTRCSEPRPPDLDPTMMSVAGSRTADRSQNGLRDEPDGQATISRPFRFLGALLPTRMTTPMKVAWFVVVLAAGVGLGFGMGSVFGGIQLPPKATLLRPRPTRSARPRPRRVRSLKD